MARPGTRYRNNPSLHKQFTYYKTQPSSCLVFGTSFLQHFNERLSVWCGRLQLICKVKPLFARERLGFQALSSVHVQNHVGELLLAWGEKRLTPLECMLLESLKVHLSSLQQLKRVRRTRHHEGHSKCKAVKLTYCKLSKSMFTHLNLCSNRRIEARIAIVNKLGQRSVLFTKPTLISPNHTKSNQTEAELTWTASLLAYSDRVLQFSPRKALQHFANPWPWRPCPVCARWKDPPHQYFPSSWSSYT